MIMYLISHIMNTQAHVDNQQSLHVPTHPSINPDPFPFPDQKPR